MGLAAAALAAELPGRTLSSAMFLASEASTPPDPNAPGWHAVPLGDRWKDEDREHLRHGWYRLQLTLDAVPNEPWAIYLPRLNMNAAVYLNGEYLGDGGRFTEPVARNWNRPLLFAAGPSQWRRGDNEILVRLASYPRYGALAPLEVGPERLLRPAFEVRRFWQNHVNIAFALLLAAVGAFMLTMWRARPQDVQYGWFAASSLALIVFCLNQFVRDIPVPAATWWWLVHGSLDVWITCLAFFVLRAMGCHRPVAERVILAYLAVVLVLFAVIPIEAIGRVTSVTMFGRFAIVFYLMGVLHGLWRQEANTVARGYFWALAGVILIGSHDALLRISWHVAPATEGLLAIWQKNFYLFNYMAPGLTLALAVHLGRRFVLALNQTEALNASLSERVAQTRSELEDSYRARATLETEAAARHERERIHRDLHDDLGARLVSLVYRVDDDTAEIARQALQDLRDIVSQDASPGRELDLVAEDWFSECQQRCERAGVALAISDPDLPAHAVPGEWVVQLSRVLREATSNALRHARPTQMNLSVRINAGQLWIELAHDGAFTPPGSWENGRGTSNMRRRLTALGGEVAWRSADGHLVTCIRLPLPESA